MLEIADLASTLRDSPHISLLILGLTRRPKFKHKSATSLSNRALFIILMLTIKVPIATLTQPITVYISDQNSQLSM